MTVPLVSVLHLVNSALVTAVHPVKAVSVQTSALVVALKVKYFLGHQEQFVLVLTVAVAKTEA